MLQCDAAHSGFKRLAAAFIPRCSLHCHTVTLLKMVAVPAARISLTFLRFPTLWRQSVGNRRKVREMRAAGTATILRSVTVWQCKLQRGINAAAKRLKPLWAASHCSMQARISGMVQVQICT